MIRNTHVGSDQSNLLIWSVCGDGYDENDDRDSGEDGDGGLR